MQSPDHLVLFFIVSRQEYKTVMAGKPPDRKCLTQYRATSIVIKRPWWEWVLTLAQAGMVLFAAYLPISLRGWPTPDLLGRYLLEAALAAGIALAVTSLLRYLILQAHKLMTRAARRRRLKRLDAKIRALVAHDYKRAIKAILGKSGLAIKDLKPIGTEYTNQLEGDLLKDTNWRKFLGPLAETSLRLVTPSGPAPEFMASPDARMKGLGPFEGYTFPTRLICLFFTHSDIVVGESVFDSRTGDLKTRVSRVEGGSLGMLKPRTDISLRTVPQEQLRHWLSELDLTNSEETVINRALLNFDKSLKRTRKNSLVAPDPPVLLSVKTKHLVLDRYEKSSLQIPMHVTPSLVRRSTAGTVRPLMARNAPSDRSRLQRLEYRSGLSLMVQLIAAVFLCSSAWALQSVLSPEKVRLALSSETHDIGIEKGGRDIPRLGGERFLSAPLSEKVRENKDWAFGCATVTTVMKATPNWRSETLSQISIHRALILQTNENPGGKALPPGWVRIQISDKGTVLTGYAAREYLEIRPDNGPHICFD